MVTNVIVINKKSYGLPIYATTNGVIYNKNIFKKYDLEIPESYEEFIQICDTLKAEGICPLAIGGNQEENMTYWLNYFFQKDIMEENPDWLEMRKERSVKFTSAESIHMLEDLKELFTLLGGFYDSPKQFEEIQKKAAPYQKSASALAYLKDLHEVLKLYQAERYISYELGALSDYHYYTGIIFSGYTFGTGEPIVKGGRYDKLLKYFGKDAPAIGFAIASDQLLAAIQRQKTEITTDKEYQLLLYPRKLQKEAILKAQELRKTGALIELLCMDETKSKENYQAYADRTGITQITYMDGE